MFIFLSNLKKRKRKENRNTLKKIVDFFLPLSQTHKRKEKKNRQPGKKLLIFRKNQIFTFRILQIKPFFCKIFFKIMYYKSYVFQILRVLLRNIQFHLPFARVFGHL